MPVVAIIHQKGGVGKSTIACNLAVVLGADLLDLDSQQSSVLFNKLRKREGIAEINCYTADTAENINEIISEHKDKLLIVDCGGFDNNLNRAVMVSSFTNLLVTPVAPSQFEIFGLQVFSKTLIEASTATNREIITHVIINNADAKSKAGIAEFKKYIVTKNNLRVFETVIHSRADFKHAIASGKSVIELNKNSKAAEEFTLFSNEIKDILKLA